MHRYTQLGNNDLGCPGVGRSCRLFDCIQVFPGRALKMLERVVDTPGRPFGSCHLKFKESCGDGVVLPFDSSLSFKQVVACFGAANGTTPVVVRHIPIRLPLRAWNS